MLINFDIKYLHIQLQKISNYKENVWISYNQEIDTKLILNGGSLLGLGQSVLFTKTVFS